MDDLGLIHLYTGCGKGKTTAAIGLMLRVLGHGGKAVLAQFLKGEHGGEREALRGLAGARVMDLPPAVKFVFQMDETEKTAYAETVQDQFLTACDMAKDCDLLVLDEALGAIETGLLPLETVTNYLKAKPQGLEVVLTGRVAPQELKDLADYVMRVEIEKHPYDRGVSARAGIEY